MCAKYKTDPSRPRNAEYEAYRTKHLEKSLMPPLSYEEWLALNPDNSADARRQASLLTDLTDDRLREAQRAMARRLLQGQGRRSTFLTEPLGAPAPRSTFLNGGG